MRKLLFIILLLTTPYCFSQISHGGTPLSLTENLTTAIPTITLSSLNTTSYINEDAITDQYKDISWRFGIERNVNYTLLNSGIWESLPDGGKLWRLEIKSPGALSINLNFSSFYLPEGATFYVFNQNTTLGSFNHLNNKLSGEFSTAPIKGQSVILEYYEPASSPKGVIEISSVVHGYRDFFKQLEVFGSSGACNINAICDISLWSNEIRSAVMMLTAGNTRFCSGALIANVPKDGTPFVLTANHCSPATNNVFMFNYQSPNCSNNLDGNTTQTISGCTLRANDGPSDFYLVELSSIPPASYNVFYSGWSNVNVAPTKGTAIHFPAGDVKKISKDVDPLIESGYYSLGNDHWQVLDWNYGTTEGGSSGAPLYDQNHRVVGQLHGGDAACGNDEFDYFGKFSISWDNNPNTSQQLKFWLDPTNTGTDVLDGYDPNGSPYTTDAVLLDISGMPPFICGDSITPKITIRNHGSSVLTSLEVHYQLDGTGFIQYNWTGSLPSYGIDSIILPTTFVPSGDHTFNAYCTNPNSTNDQNLSNDSSSINFKSNANPTFATLHLNTDNFGAETSWVVRDANGNIYLESSRYPSVSGGQQITESLCLYDSCFTFIIKDSYGDGFCCSFGNGSFYLEDNYGDTIACAGLLPNCSTGNFNTDSLAFPFCLNTNGIVENETGEFNVFPNPSKGIFTVTSSHSSLYNVRIYDLLGNIVMEKYNLRNESIIDLTQYNKGMYLLLIESKKEQTTKRLVIH